jgi:superfamily II DNA or RNA helicase
MNVSIKKSAKKRLKLFCDNSGLLNHVKRQFSVKNPNAKYMRWGQEILSCISPSYTFHHGLAIDIIKAIKEFDPTIIVDVSDVKDIIMPMSLVTEESELEQPKTEFDYHDYQLDSVQLGLKFGRGIFELATSAGKSLIIYGLIRNYVNKLGRKTFLVLVPGKQHVAQMAGDLEEYGWNSEDICQFTAERDRSYAGQSVIISNTSWILLHGKELPDIDIVMIDEVHGLKPGNKISTYVSKLPTHMKFGFTGTLPSDMMAKWNVIGLTGPVLKKIRAKVLQDRGFIALNHMIAIKFIHNKRLNPPEELTRLMRMAEEDGNPDLIGEMRLQLAKSRFPTEWHYIEDCEFTNQFIVRMMCSFPGNTIMLYDHTIHGDKLEEYARTISPDRKIFRIDGSVSVDDREDVREAMENYNDCLLIANTKCVSTGISIKNINNIGFCFSAGTSSAKIIQSIGRGLRLKRGKRDVKIVDFWHDFRYSIDHFNQRVKMYEEHYEKGMKDIIHKNVQVSDTNYIDKL